jgi:hypothetical protein
VTAFHLTLAFSCYTVPFISSHTAHFEIHSTKTAQIAVPYDIDVVSMRRPHTFGTKSMPLKKLPKNMEKGKT